MRQCEVRLRLHRQRRSETSRASRAPDRSRTPRAQPPRRHGPSPKPCTRVWRRTWRASCSRHPAGLRAPRATAAALFAADCSPAHALPPAQPPALPPLLQEGMQVHVAGQQGSASCALTSTPLLLSSARRLLAAVRVSGREWRSLSTLQQGAAALSGGARARESAAQHWWNRLFAGEEDGGTCGCCTCRGVRVPAHVRRGQRRLRARRSSGRLVLRTSSSAPRGRSSSRSCDRVGAAPSRLARCARRGKPLRMARDRRSEPAPPVGQELLNVTSSKGSCRRLSS